MHKSTTSKRKLPDTWLVVFFILVVIAILTWVVPSGSFDYETIDIDGAARKVALREATMRSANLKSPPLDFSACLLLCMRAASARRTLFL